MAKARRLAKESGTTNVPVTMWTFNDRADEAVGSYLVQLLKDLGYQAHLHAVSSDRYWTAIYNSRNKVQVGVTGWAADFPAASDFFLPDLSCHSFYDDSTSISTNNQAGFCDPQIDKLASKAQAAQLTDPAYARRLWAQVDRIVTNQAPWAPVYDKSTTVFVSARVGNYQDSPFYGPLIDQMWVR